MTLPLQIRRIDRGLARELLKIGWPAAADMLVLNLGFVAALRMLGYISQVTVAAHNLGMRVQSLAFVPGLGVAQATGALVGQSLGANNADRARAVARASMVLCSSLMTALGLAILLGAYPLVHVLSAQPGSPLEAFSVEWMRLLGYAMPPVGISIALMGVFQGSGATMTSLRINIWSTLAIQIPLAYVLGFTCDLGATGVWLSFPLAAVAKAALGWVAFRRATWAVTGVRVVTPAVADA